MENKREYYKVKIPNPNSQIAKALEVSINSGDTQNYSIDRKTVIIKTDTYRIKREVDKGVSFDKIFPPGLTTKLTKKEAQDLANSKEFLNLDTL